mmetsp:Transcript_118512/g.177111  ORF Transcript_118512/g.177111 Transcript_118512/m.177111 type:complete len:209 (-) Transcript_118512:531-1157(-)
MALPQGLLETRIVIVHLMNLEDGVTIVIHKMDSGKIPLRLAPKASRSLTFLECPRLVPPTLQVDRILSRKPCYHRLRRVSNNKIRIIHPMVRVKRMPQEERRPHCSRTSSNGGIQEDNQTCTEEMVARCSRVRLWHILASLAAHLAIHHLLIWGHMVVNSTQLLRLVRRSKQQPRTKAPMARTCSFSIFRIISRIWICTSFFAPMAIC